MILRFRTDLVLPWMQEMGREFGGYMIRNFRCEPADKDGYREVRVTLQRGTRPLTKKLYNPTSGKMYRIQFRRYQRITYWNAIKLLLIWLSSKPSTREGVK